MDDRLPTTPRRTRTADRKLKALTRRIGGFTLQQIGDELGITRQAVSILVKSALSDLNGEIAESAAELRRLELERLDTMRAAVWGGVLKGDLQSIDRALKISARLAALAGLDAPVKSDIDGKVELVVMYDDKSHRDTPPDAA